MTGNEMDWASGTWGGGTKEMHKNCQKTERKDRFEGVGTDGRIPTN
jgi:hypothetical protein